jgi:hypothetical protein
MAITQLNPPIEYLQSASRSSLQSFELARLNHAANLRREIAMLIDQWMKETSEALLARWMLDHQNSLRPPPLPAAELLRTIQLPVVDPLPTFPQPLDEVFPAPQQRADSSPATVESRRQKASRKTPPLT